MYTVKQKYKIFDYLRNVLKKNKYSCQTVVRFVKSKNSTYQQQRLEYQGIPTLSVGAGARSYTNNISYCLTYKVNDNLVKSIIQKYLFAYCHHYVQTFVHIYTYTQMHMYIYTSYICMHVYVCIQTHAS